MMKKNLKVAVALILFIIETSLIFGQTEYPPLSGKGRIIQEVGNTQVEIEYERPSARDRTIFGALVPYNSVWRTGAGYCTKISFNKPVIIGGQPVNAGTYAVFTIPNPNEWVLILNSDTALYGSSNYDSKNDVARFVVKPHKTQRYYETLTFDIDLIPNNARVYISWENTEISFDLLTNTDELLMNYINEFLLTKKETAGNRYANAAEQLYFLNFRLNTALKLCEIALEKHKDEDHYTKGYVYRVKMEIYEKLHLYQEAIEVINQAIENEKYKNEIPRWKKHKERIEGKLKC